MNHWPVWLQSWPNLSLKHQDKQGSSRTLVSSSTSSFKVVAFIGSLALTGKFWKWRIDCSGSQGQARNYAQISWQELQWFRILQKPTSLPSLLLCIGAVRNLGMRPYVSSGTVCIWVGLPSEAGPSHLACLCTLADSIAFRHEVRCRRFPISILNANLRFSETLWELIVLDLHHVLVVHQPTAQALTTITHR